MLVVVSGRADASPLRRLVEILGCPVLNLEGDDPGACVARTQVAIRGKKIVILLGDRFETCSASLACVYEGVAIAHIHGGETTTGSFDDQFRNAITMMADYHFVAAPEYDRRVRSLGKSRVWCFGAPGLDNLTDMIPRVAARKFVVTFHPTTRGADDVHEMIDALDSFSGYDQVWTGVNNDPGNEAIRIALKGRNVNATLGLKGYIDACRTSTAVVGNSSSGIIEAPVMGVPTVNVGVRQDGRLKSPSVFDAKCEAGDIARAIECALSFAGPYTSLHGMPGASEKIAGVVRGLCHS